MLICVAIIVPEIQSAGAESGTRFMDTAGLPAVNITGHMCRLTLSTYFATISRVSAIAAISKTAESSIAGQIKVADAAVKSFQRFHKSTLTQLPFFI